VAKLGDECDVVLPDADFTRGPWLLAPHLCQTRDAQLVVYVHCDVIVTRSLAPILCRAREGSICAFPDLDHDRTPPTRTR